MEINRIKLTPDQKRKWDDTTMLMGFKCPGFVHLWYRLMAHNEDGYVGVMTDSVPIAATDAKNILINPNTFFEYKLPERVFIGAHEIVHNMFGDVEFLHRCNRLGKVPMNDGTFLPFDNETMQISMDERINALLKEGNIGKMPADACFDEKVVGGASVLDVYRKNYVPKPEDDNDGEGEGDGKGKGKGKGQDNQRGSGKKGSGFDNILEPGTSTNQNPDTAAAERNQQEYNVEIAAAQIIEQSRSQGKMAGALQRMFKQLLEPEIPWTEQIQGQFARKLGGGGYDWRKPDRRCIVRDLYAPSRSGNGAGWVICGCDVSGSVVSETERYLGEVSGIIDEVQPKRLTVVWWDDGICQVDELTDAGDLHDLNTRGVKNAGGGTDIKHLYNWIEENSNGEMPDMVLVFTDGYFTFPKKPPPYEQLWISTTDYKYPWGTVIRLPNKKK